MIGRAALPLPTGVMVLCKQRRVCVTDRQYHLRTPNRPHLLRTSELVSNGIGLSDRENTSKGVCELIKTRYNYFMAFWDTK